MKNNKLFLTLLLGCLLSVVMLTDINAQMYDVQVTQTALCITNPLVTTNADAGPGSLRQAIIDACPGSIITFNMEAGFVTSPINLTGGQLVIDKNLTIQGPGASLLAVRSATSGNRVFYVENVTATISGLTIKDGSLFPAVDDDNQQHYDGSGILNYGDLTLEGCIVSDNLGTGHFALVERGARGIGMSNHETLHVNNSIIQNNTEIPNLIASEGGGIFNAGTAFVNNSNISNNLAVLGGGIGNGFQGQLTVTNSTISNNNNSVPAFYGGGISNWYHISDVTVINSTILGNKANNGAGIYSAGNFTVTNSTVSGNMGVVGGGISAELGVMNLTNATITNNTVTVAGGGIFNGDDVNHATINSVNSIIAGNFAAVAGTYDYGFETNGVLPQDYGLITSLGYNIFGKVDAPYNGGMNGTGDQLGSTASPSNPLLDVLANNGGPTMTHALLPGSPAINAGTNTGAPTTDQRGIARPQGAGSDIGAFELVATALPTNPSGVGTSQPSTVPAGETVLLTITVTPGINPASTGLAVTGDLSSIGGSAAQTFFDNGTNGDVTSGDNVFSFQATVNISTTVGAKTIPVTITDAQARSDNPSISLTVDPPLPVELTSFTARVSGKIITLNWQTATEVNNYGFEIERSLTQSARGGLSQGEGFNKWEKIGFVPGNGNSNSPKEYSLTDKNPNGGSKFIYRLKQIDSDGKFEYSDEVEVEIVPNEFALYQNFPNPFNPSTVINYSLPTASNVKLEVFNVTGENVATLVDGFKNIGNYEVSFEASGLPSGMYLYRISAGTFVQTRKMILIR
jgi:hypothetical protein